jgi:hypothetical protein
MNVTGIGFAPRSSSGYFEKSKLKPTNFSPQRAWHRAMPLAFNSSATNQLGFTFADT